MVAGPVAQPRRRARYAALSPRLVVGAVFATALVVRKLSSTAFTMGSGSTSPINTASPAANHLRTRSADAVIPRQVIASANMAKYEAPKDLMPPDSGDVIRSETGLVSQVLRKGEGGKRPGTATNVNVRYSGWLSKDGTLFDSSYLQNEDAEFCVRDVIPGWSEGLQLMEVGEMRRFWIPAALGYGEENPEDERGFPLGDLVFDVELIKTDDPGDNLLQVVGGVFVVLFGLTVVGTEFLPKEGEEGYQDRGAIFSFTPKVKQNGVYKSIF